MIESGIFTKSVFRESQIMGEETDAMIQSSGTVNRAAMFHLINAHIFQIFNNGSFNQVNKNKLVHEFGYKLGQSLVEEECLGYVKYCVKNDGKEFVGEMKLLNAKIWQSLVGSKGKLFSISNETLTSSSYKIEDKQFALGKAFANSTDPKEKALKCLLVTFCQGFVEGSLEKVNISGEITCAEGTESTVYVEMKNLVRKKKGEKFDQYYDATTSGV